jgi:ribonucleoside-diphosphate reductase alpha chain
MNDKKIYSYQDVLTASIEYFDGDTLAAKVFSDKYALKNKDGEYFESTPKDMHNRLASEFSRIESKKFKNPLTKDEIFNLFDKFKYIIPQGSPLFGIGNNFQIISLSNCYVLETPKDSYSSILKVDEQLVNISKRRGGVGINLSNLRPEGASTNNAAISSSGIVTWMERYSNSIREVGQNARRGALMLTLAINHYDIEKFIEAKKDSKKVTGANISVMLSQDFIDKVNKDEDFILQWPIDTDRPKLFKTVKAKYLWDLLIKSARDNAEPGILMWDNILKGPADCYESYRSVCTNPCSEIPLSSYDSCRLICLNLFSYVENPFTKNAIFDFTLFNKHVKIAQRLMDDLVDLESEKINTIIGKILKDPESDEIKKDELSLWKKVKKFNDEGRRTGLGITALGDTLAALGIKYGSEESILKTEEFYKNLKLSAYESSVDMAEEIGSFKDFDFEKEKDNEFLLRIKEENSPLYKRMQKYGRRNIALLTTAPTGTVSILAQTSSGIEPVFQLSYIRRKKINSSDKEIKVDFVDQSGDSWQEFTVYHPKLKSWMDISNEKDIKKSPWYNCTANDINWINRVKMQAIAQRHVCHAISSTINLPNNVTNEVVSEIYKTAFQMGCKGMTIYREGCRSGVLINTNEKDLIIKTTAPKRKETIEGELHFFVVDGVKYYAAVGLLNKEPFEIFTGKNVTRKDVYIPKEEHVGCIKKVKRGKYVFLSESGEEYDLTNGHSDNTASALSRIISASLRHGCDLKFLVEQLLKTEGHMMSFSKVLARTLKRYIKDGSTSTEECSECKTKMIFQSGCSLCPNCGLSRCQ